MIQKFLITFFIIIIFLYAVRVYKKIMLKNFDKKKEEEIIDLEKDPKTNTYSPKEK